MNELERVVNRHFMGCQTYLGLSCDCGAEEAEKELAHLQNALRACVDWLDNAPFDYSNGNAMCGVDEGNVRGWEGHQAIVNNAKLALGDLPVVSPTEEPCICGDGNVPF
jgi:hypothetical protein